MRYRKTEILVGAFSLAALAILIGVTVNLKKSTIFSRKYPLLAYFKDVKRLEDGAPVYVHGVVRGDVRQIQATGDRDYPVCVVMMLTTGTVLHQHALPRVVAAGLMGETEINIDDTSPSAPALLPGDSLYGVHVMDISDLLAEAPGVVEDLQKSIGAVSEILTEPRHRQAVTNILESVSSITVKVDRMLGSSATDITDALHNIRTATERLDQLVARADAILTTFGANLSEVGAGLSGVVGDLQTSSSLLIKELTAAVRRIDQTTSRANQLITTAQGILSENRDHARLAIEGLTSASIHLGRILARIDTGEATLVQVLMGQEAFADLSGSLRGLRDSMETVSRWLEALDRWLTGAKEKGQSLPIRYEIPPAETVPKKD